MFQMWTKNIDKILIILKVLLEIYENNHITEVRRSVLKDRCNDELFKKTDGREDTYGGSFERYVKELEEKKALKIIHKSKKNTIIVPNITRIKHLLTSQRLSGLLDESTPHFTEEEIQQSTWEEIIEKEVGRAVDNIVKELVQRSNTLSKSFSENSMIKKSHPLMREEQASIISFRIAFISCSYFSCNFCTSDSFSCCFSKVSL